MTYEFCNRMIKKLSDLAHFYGIAKFFSSKTVVSAKFFPSKTVVSAKFSKMQAGSAQEKADFFKYLQKKLDI